MRAPSLLTVVPLALLGLALPASPAHATGTSYMWIGASNHSGGDNHSWTDARNWSPQGVPGDGDSVDIHQPGGGYCSAYVDEVPAVSLATLSIAGTANTCGTRITGGPVTVTGGLTWNGGQVVAPITVAAGATGQISGGGQNELDADLDVHGSLTLSGVSGPSGRLAFSVYPAQAATIHVEPGATLTSQGSNDLVGNTGTLLNEGTVVEQGGTFDLGLGAKLVNDGTVRCNDGTFQVNGGDVTLGAGGSYAGNGTFQLINAAASITADQTVGAGSTFELGGADPFQLGSIDGSATIGGPGSFLWEGGTLSGAALAIGTTGGITVTGANQKNLANTVDNAPSVVDLTAPATFTAGTDRDHENVLDLWQDTLRLKAPTTLNSNVAINSGTLVNLDHLTVSPGADGFVDRGATTRNLGTVSVGAGTFMAWQGYTQNSGVTDLSSGSTLSGNFDSTPISINGGTLSGSGDVFGALSVGSATVSPGGSRYGTLSATSLHEHRGSRISLQLSSTKRDKVAVSGSVALAGTLHVQNASSYSPHVGSTVTVLTAGSVTGKPACVATSGGGAHAGHWKADTTGSALKLVWATGRSTCS